MLSAFWSGSAGTSAEGRSSWLCSVQPRAQARTTPARLKVLIYLYAGLEKLLKLHEVNTMENGFFPAHLSKALVINAVK